MSEQRDYRDTVFLPKTEFPMKAGLPQKEPGILARWQGEDLYRRLRDARAGREKFILHDGPPYANGDMHIGHALNHVLKDMVCRTQSLLGKDAPYVPGWDCHGLPIEWKVEEQYRKKKLDKDQVPLLEFRAECRAYAQHWVDVQREQVKRLGILGDWDHPYLTMDPEAEGTIVAELLKFAESGQLYRGAKPVMWSPVEKTALAEAEVEYEDIVSTQVDVAFEIVESPIAELVGAYAVIWTTTPWTIPVNQALAYGPEVEYVRCWFRGEEALRLPSHLRDSKFLIAKELTGHFQNRVLQAYSELPRLGLEFEPAIKGSELFGTIARHPMANLFTPSPLAGEGQAEGQGEGTGAVSDPSPSLAPLTFPSPARGEGLDPSSPLAEFFLRPRPFLPGEFVTTETGTGLVHMAPDHGEDDFLLCKAHGIDPVFAVEADGKYRADWAWLGGQGSVINPKFNAPDGPICTDLKSAGGLLAASADYPHSYPHSWRSKAKVIFRCTPQWFVPMDRPVLLPHAKTAAEKVWENEGGATIHDHATLRQLATRAIEATRFVPEKGRNRIGSMVEGRPDWVLSRQRAWGVPITLFVNRKSGQYLDDPAVNARIVAAVKAGGVDAWSDANAYFFLNGEQEHSDPDASRVMVALLPDLRNPEDYERVTDILDVWFDSGSTHAFVLESGRWPDLVRPEGYEGPLADMYLEGSDQHRGWFQSSLLEACATRGHAPYKTVLTHGFTMDAKGLKQSKSLGNATDPLKVMETYGADIIRLWALTVDFTEDHRIGDEILKGVSDQYRKLRNTFRYLLGALDGFSEAERVSDVAAMPELERYVLALLAKLDATLRQAVADYDFNTYVRALTDFCNEDLSAFYFDIRKDCLYCDAADSPKRMAYRSVLDTLFHALVRYAAPVLVFTAEEVWGARFADGGSVHLLEWPEVPLSEVDLSRWEALRVLRSEVLEAIEPLRREKLLGSGLEAAIELNVTNPLAQHRLSQTDLPELFITGEVGFAPIIETRSTMGLIVNTVGVSVSRSGDHKCGRCWRHLPEVTEDSALCSRCDQVVGAMEPME